MQTPVLRLQLAKKFRVNANEDLLVKGKKIKKEYVRPVSSNIPKSQKPKNFQHEVVAV